MAIFNSYVSSYQRVHIFASKRTPVAALDMFACWKAKRAHSLLEDIGMFCMWETMGMTLSRHWMAPWI